MSTTVGLTFQQEDIDESEKLKCPHCENEYKTQEGLDKHVLLKHTENE